MFVWELGEKNKGTGNELERERERGTGGLGAVDAFADYQVAWLFHCRTIDVPGINNQEVSGYGMLLLIRATNQDAANVFKIQQPSLMHSVESQSQHDYVRRQWLCYNIFAECNTLAFVQSLDFGCFQPCSTLHCVHYIINLLKAIHTPEICDEIFAFPEKSQLHLVLLVIQGGF